MGLVHLLTTHLNICVTKESRMSTLAYQICRTRAKRFVPRRARYIMPCLSIDRCVCLSLLQLYPIFALSLGNMPEP